MPLSSEAEAVLAKLAEPNAAVARRWSGLPEGRQPVHTVYGGAQLFRADVASRMGKRALTSLHTYAPDPIVFAQALGIAGADTLPEKKKKKGAILADARSELDELASSDPAALAVRVYERVLRKLSNEPVEDFRIDFEDGFGHRPDDEEDAVAIVAAEQVARGLGEGSLPPFIGLRIKPLHGGLERRAASTLDLFLTTLLERSEGRLPDPFIVTLPKVTAPSQVEALGELLSLIEQAHGVEVGTIRVELMIETTAALFDGEGRFALPRLADAAGARLFGAHFGTYDYTATNDITAGHQTMDHPVSRLALHLMKIGYSNQPLFLSDGATNVLPVPVHRGDKLKKKHRAENERAVHEAWALSYRNIRGSLEHGLYQGWDLHPAQLPVRYAATYAFFLEGFDPAAARLRNFVEQAAQATLVGDVFDDAATGQGLLNYFLRALNAGAVSLDELEATGLTREEIQTRSFAKILAGRRGGT